MSLQRKVLFNVVAEEQIIDDVAKYGAHFIDVADYVTISFD